MAKTVADLLIERLIGWGVDTIFGLPGDGINGIFEALRTRQDKIRFIQVRHEEAAAFAACGYAKYTGRLGVCLATSGPGGIHLLNGLYDAKCDGQPVLAITGHTFHDLIGTHYQQDVDLDKLFMDVAAYNQRVMGPAHVVNVVDEAIKTALARRGVAHITIPKDIQEWTTSDEQRVRHERRRGTAPTLAPRTRCRRRQPLQAAADVINAGNRRSRSSPAAAASARATRCCSWPTRVAGPIVKPLLGKAVVPDDSPYTTGGIGLLGTAPSQDAHAGVRHADHRRHAASRTWSSTQARPGQRRADRHRPDPHRPAASRRRRPGRRLRERCCDALLPLLAAQDGPQLPREGAGADGAMERADARTAARATTCR